MKKENSLLLYGFFCTCLFLFDRISKFHALTSWVRPYKVSGFISFELHFNRGISWGMLSQVGNFFMWGITTFIAILTLFLMYQAYIFFRARFCIAPELMIIVGSVSNLYDRIFYPGVIDFIACSAYGFHWPVFNFADVWIVAGITMMFFMRR